MKNGNKKKRQQLKDKRRNETKPNQNQNKTNQTKPKQTLTNRNTPKQTENTIRSGIWVLPAALWRTHGVYSLINSKWRIVISKLGVTECFDTCIDAPACRKFMEAVAEQVDAGLPDSDPLDNEGKAPRGRRRPHMDEDLKRRLTSEIFEEGLAHSGKPTASVKRIDGRRLREW